MHDDVLTPPPDLAADLAQYFALTTAVPLPPGVRRVDARMLAGRRHPMGIGGRALGALVGGAGAVAAAVAAVVILAAGHHLGAIGSSGLSSPADRGAGAVAVPEAVAYPGVDLSALGRSGYAISSAAGHGVAALTPAQAQTAAANAQANAEAPAPAVLVWARFEAQPQRGACLCWIVDVPIRGGVANDLNALGRPGIPAARTVLVFVDAASGRVVDTVSAPGIP